MGDLNLRAGARGRVRSLLRRLTLEMPVRREGSISAPAASKLLALDWTGADSELLLGRHQGCDVRLTDASVSRRHAQLRFRDGHWILQDRDSTNGTRVNGVRVGRCELRPVARRRRKSKAILVAEAGGCCCVCGYDRSVAALEFHHLDRTKKVMSVSARGIAYALNTLRAEAAKCVLLCANCHVEVETGLIQLPIK